MLDKFCLVLRQPSAIRSNCGVARHHLWYHLWYHLWKRRVEQLEFCESLIGRSFRWIYLSRSPCPPCVVRPTGNVGVKLIRTSLASGWVGRQQTVRWSTNSICQVHLLSVVNNIYFFIQLLKKIMYNNNKRFQFGDKLTGNNNKPRLCFEQTNGSSDGQVEDSG